MGLSREGLFQKRSKHAKSRSTVAGISALHRTTAKTFTRLSTCFLLGRMKSPGIMLWYSNTFTLLKACKHLKAIFVRPAGLFAISGTKILQQPLKISCLRNRMADLSLINLFNEFEHTHCSRVYLLMLFDLISRKQWLRKQGFFINSLGTLLGFYAQLKVSQTKCPKNFQ